MLLRSRLKKEPVNLLISKNKRLFILCYCLLVIVSGLYLISEFKNDMPEDKYLFSGNSVVKGILEKNDNYSSVSDYKYESDVMEPENIHLKNLNFSFLEEITFHPDQYLQGICFTDDYILISSYSSKFDCLGELMVFQKNSGEYLITLGLDKMSHLGGIAFDGKNIWICNSSKMSIERISYEYLCEKVENHSGEMVDIRNDVEVYRVSIIPSCITFYNNKLLIATHTKWANSRMMAYVYDDKNDILEYYETYRIPSKVQGIAFDEEGKVFFSTSYGRKKSSYIKVYDSIDSMADDVENYSKIIEMPPCSEGIDFYNNKLYVVFESAGRKFLEGTDGKGKSIAPLDKILIISPL